MFGLLDYESWRIFRDDVEIALVTLNGTDRSVSVRLFDQVAAHELPLVATDKYFTWWTWVIEHRALS